MDEPIHDLLAHLAVDRHGVGKPGSEANSAGKATKSTRKSAAMTPATASTR